MGFFSAIGGMLPDVYIGAQRGAEAELARQDREVDRQHQAKLRQAQEQLLPLQTEAETGRLKATVATQKNEADLAPTRQAIAKSDLEHRASAQPDAQRLERSQLQRHLDGELFADAEQLFKGQKTVEAVTESFNARAGRALLENDMEGVTRIFQHMVKAPNIFPGLNGKPLPTGTEVVAAPEGATDFTGQPIKGTALKLTFEDGSTALANPRYILGARQKQMEAERQASLKTVKPGETIVDVRSGKEVYSAPARPPNGWIRDENGDLQFLGGAGGTGGSGAGSSGRGKAPPTPAAEALSFFENITKNAEAKLPGDQLAKGQDYTARAASAGIAPQTAARIGHDAATTPEKVKPRLNLDTGAIDGVYSDRNTTGGREITLAPGYMTAAEYRKAYPDDLTGAQQMVGEMLSVLSAEQRAEITQAAQDPVKSAAMVRQAGERGGPAAAAAAELKLDAIRVFSPPAAKKTERANPFAFVGGMVQAPREGYNQVDPNSRAGKTQARQAEARAANERQATERSERQAALSKQFQADAKAMPPLELARKYNDLRSQLPTADAAALQQIERQIR